MTGARRPKGNRKQDGQRPTHTRAHTRRYTRMYRSIGEQRRRGEGVTYDDERCLEMEEIKSRKSTNGTQPLFATTSY